MKAITLFRLSPSGEPLNPTFVLSCSVFNIICSMIFGRHFDYDDESLLPIIHLMNDSLAILSSRWVQVRRPRYLGNIKQRAGSGLQLAHLAPPLPI